MRDHYNHIIHSETSSLPSSSLGPSVTNVFNQTSVPDNQIVFTETSAPISPSLEHRYKVTNEKRNVPDNNQIIIHTKAPLSRSTSPNRVQSYQQPTTHEERDGTGGSQIVYTKASLRSFSTSPPLTNNALEPMSGPPTGSSAVTYRRGTSYPTASPRRVSRGSLSGPPSATKPSSGISRRSVGVSTSFNNSGVPPPHNHVRDDDGDGDGDDHGGGAVGDEGVIGGGAQDPNQSSTCLESRCPRVKHRRGDCRYYKKQRDQCIEEWEANRRLREEVDALEAEQESAAQRGNRGGPSSVHVLLDLILLVPIVLIIYLLVKFVIA